MATLQAGLRFPRSFGFNRPSLPLRRTALGLLPVLALYVLYSGVRFLVADRGPRLGPGHARWIVDAETRLHLAWEQPLQRVALHHDWIARFANWYYVMGFLPVLVAGAVGCAAFNPAAFAHWRRVFGISLLIALGGFALFPVAPPRLLGGHGYVDTLMLYGPHYYGDTHGSSLFNGYGRLPSMVNVYAAMPSMHVAWSAIAGALFAAAIGRSWACSLIVIHPLLMALTVIVTGNHYLFDVLGGLVTLAISLRIASSSFALPRFERGRANPWNAPTPSHSLLIQRGP